MKLKVAHTRQIILVIVGFILINLQFSDYTIGLIIHASGLMMGVVALIWFWKTKRNNRC